MKKKLTLLGVLVLASVSWVSAQTGRLASVDIPFEFTVGQTVLPAGNYSVDRDGNTNFLSFRETSGKNNKTVLIVSRRAQFTNGSEPSTLVFDEVGSRRYLSEVRFSGQDGLVVRRTSEKHSHQVLQAEKHSHRSLDVDDQKTE